MPRSQLSGKRRSKGKTADGKPNRRPRVDAAEREKEILEAAVNVFHAKSFAATSVDDLADEVGILKGSLYYYMDGKEDLLFRIVEDVHEDVEEIVQRTLVKGEGSPLERLAAYVKAVVEYNARNIKRVRVYYHDYDQLNEERLGVVRKRRRAHERTLIKVLGEAKKAKEVPADLDEALAAKTIFGTVLWMYTWFKPAGPISGSSLGAFCSDFVLGGIQGSGGSKPSSRSRR